MIMFFYFYDNLHVLNVPQKCHGDLLGGFIFKNVMMTSMYWVVFTMS